MAVTAAQLLDELMGKDRNRAPGEPSSKHHWSDAEVCKYYLCGFCPHELFTNTKADLGTCPKVHDEALKKEYERSSRKPHMGYEETFMRFLQGIMADVERRIRRGHERLALNAKKEKELKSAKGDDEKISMISDHINQLVNETESLGTDGKVEEAQGVMKLVEQLKEEKETLIQMTKLNPLSSQEKQMEVCEICGAFLIVGDAQSRVDDHLQGKQHVGYARIKTTLEEMKADKWRPKIRDEKVPAEEDKIDQVSEKEQPARRGSSSREGSKDRVRRKDRERSRERNRSRDKRERDRSTERKRDKRRSRSRDRRSPSRDRYRRHDKDKRRSRSRDGNRRQSRERERKRSRSKERNHRRSRSRERRGSRSEIRSQRKSRSRSRSRNRRRSNRGSVDSERSEVRRGDHDHPKVANIDKPSRDSKDKPEAGHGNNREDKSNHDLDLDSDA